MSKLAQDINSVGAELFEGRLAQDINSVDAELVQETQSLVLTAPANGETGVSLSATFTWTDSESRGLYRLVYDTDINFGSPTVVWTETTSHNATLTSGTYYWKVEAHNTVQQNVIPTGAIDNNSKAGDEESLELFAQNLGVAGWNDNTGWATSGMDLNDTIYGVTTATIGGELRVTEIDLLANGLVGTIPEFPGLQECTLMRFKQWEEGMSTSTPPERITGTIPDSIGNNTKVTHLSLSGRKFVNGTQPHDVFQYASDELPDYNKKASIAANQFTGGIPSSLYNLNLEVFEIDGQNGQFGGTLEAGCGNWTNLTHFYAHGNMWHNTTGSAWGGTVPSEVKNWTNNIFISMGDNVWSGYANDMFEGWVDNGRYFSIGWDAVKNYPLTTAHVNQSIPDFSGLTQAEELRFRGLGWTGQYPKYSVSFPNIDVILLGEHRFTDSRDLELQQFGNVDTYSIGSNSTIFNTGLTGSLFTGAVNKTKMILFDVRVLPNLKDILAEGMETWSNLRTFRGQATGGSVLTSRPPGEYGCSLTLIHLQGSGIVGQYPTEWSKAGSLRDRGGVFDTGTITNFGTDGTSDHWIEDDSKNYATNELVGKVLHNVNSGSGTKRREILSNTSIRIYYRHWLDELDRDFDVLSIGNPFEIERNQNTDNRPFDDDYLLNNNLLSGGLPIDGAPTEMVGGKFDISNNLYRMKDLAPIVALYEKKARENWAISSKASVSGDVTFTFNGVSTVVSLTSTDSLDVQAQQIADDINADTNIEITCEYISDAEVIIFSHNLTGITNALKEVSFTDTDSTGFSFRTNGYNFVYAPQKDFSTADLSLIGKGGSAPSDEVIELTAGDSYTIDYSGQEYTGNVYTWYLNGSVISGATSSSYTVSSYTEAMDGDEYYLEITNPDAPDLTAQSITTTLTTDIV